MSERFSRPVVLDATVLSNYASTDSVTWLTTTLDALQTVPAVRNELEQGREVGYAYLEHALDVLESGRIGIAETAPEQLQQDYPTVQTRLDPGEAEALVAAHTADGTLVTRSEWKPTPSQLLLIRLLSLLTSELTEREIAVHLVHGSQNRYESE